MGNVALERSAQMKSRTPISENRRTESGTVDGEKAATDADLAKVMRTARSRAFGHPDACEGRCR